MLRIHLLSNKLFELVQNNSDFYVKILKYIWVPQQSSSKKVNTGLMFQCLCPDVTLIHVFLDHLASKPDSTLWPCSTQTSDTYRNI